jgi:RNA polymerase sigma-70 factor, ECF subfamily
MASGILRRFAVAARASAAVERAPSLRAATLLESSGGAGAKSTLEAVYAEHFRYVWRCLRGLGVESQVLDDAVHEVFLVVQRRLPEFDGADAQLTTWLYEIAFRVAQRHRTQAAKEARRYAPLASGADDSEGQAAPGLVAGDLHAEVERTSQIAFAKRALQVLDAEKREVFVLAFVEQLSAPEIVQITGVPLNTVYSRMRAARRLFAEEVERLTAGNQTAQSEPGAKA